MRYVLAVVVAMTLASCNDGESTKDVTDLGNDPPVDCPPDDCSLNCGLWCLFNCTIWTGSGCSAACTDVDNDGCLDYCLGHCPNTTKDE